MIAAIRIRAGRPDEAYVLAAPEIRAEAARLLAEAGGRS